MSDTADMAFNGDRQECLSASMGIETNQQAVQVRNCIRTSIYVRATRVEGSVVIQVIHKKLRISQPSISGVKSVSGRVCNYIQ